jgi:hypothetical protein
MSGEVVRYNILSGRFAVLTRCGFIVAELRSGQVAEGLILEWEDPIYTPARFQSATRSVVEAAIVDINVPSRELMALLGPW